MEGQILGKLVLVSPFHVLGREVGNLMIKVSEPKADHDTPEQVNCYLCGKTFKHRYNKHQH